VVSTHGSSEWKGFELNSATAVLWRRDLGTPVTDKFSLNRARAVSSVLCAQREGAHTTRLGQEGYQP